MNNTLSLLDLEKDTEQLVAELPKYKGESHEIEATDKKRKCIYCGGTGYERWPDKRCWPCGGTGYAP